MVLYNLILNNAHSGLLNRHFRQRNTLLVRSHGRGAENLIDLLLRIGRESALRVSDSLQSLFELFHAVYYLVSCVCVHTFRLLFR